MKKESGYVLPFDLMNIAACISVVILHVNGAFWAGPTQSFWRSTLFAETAFYWAVPVFFMLTGATLMDYRKRYTTKEYFKKRILKTLIPFFAWSLISIPWSIYVNHSLDILEISTWQGLVNTIANTKAMSIYWFFPPLFAVYLCIPALSEIPEDKRKTVFGYIIVCSFVLDSFIPVVASLFGVYISSAMYFPLNYGGYVLFLLLGYWITNYPISKRQRLIVYLAGVFGWAIRYFYTLHRSLRIGEIDGGLTGYGKFPSVLLAVAVFVWFWYHDWSRLNKPNIVKWVRTISGASFGVYLVHMYVMTCLVNHFQIQISTLSWRIWGISAVYVISLVLVLIGKRIPAVKKLFP